MGKSFREKRDKLRARRTSKDCSDSFREGVSEGKECGLFGERERVREKKIDGKRK